MRRSALRSTVITVVVFVFALLGAPAAIAADQPPVPQQVEAYFASDLIPRLVDLYGSKGSAGQGLNFDDTTKVGEISRVYEWTPDFLAGQASDDPTRATNNWVAAVSARGAVVGLATVWINPATDLPELASFDSAGMAARLAAAPEKSRLVYDSARSAWFALSADSLTSLVDGTSGVTGVTTVNAYQRSISLSVMGESSAPPTESGFSGIAISALVLGVVILGLAIFVLLPVGKRPAKGASDEDEAEPDKAELDEAESDKAEPDEPAHDDAKQDGAEKDGAEQDGAEQDGAEQDGAEQDNADLKAPKNP